MLSNQPLLRSSSRHFLLQGVQLPKCRLLVALIYQEDLERGLAADIRSIAEASAILQQKGVELIVQLKPSAADNALPPEDDLERLAPVIQRVKCCKLRTVRHPTEGSSEGSTQGSTEGSTEGFTEAYGFSAAHISALSDATTSLQELCVSDCNVDPEYWGDIMSDASMATIATFSCLTRLDLICCGSPALQALGQLSQLQKLGLHLKHEGVARETCCEAVLLSNKAGLRKVHLDGYAWSDATYLALLTLTSLQVLTLTVSTISSPSAYILGDVVATRCMSIWFQESDSIADCVLQGLTSSCANITSLQLDHMSRGKFQHVCTMEHLSSLTISRPNCFTGCELVTQPSLPHLKLDCCRDLDTEGLRHIVCVFPNLTSMSMSAESQAPWPIGCTDSFVELSQLRKLELLNLSGLDHITADQAEALERAIRAQQELGLLQPNLRLCLQIPKVTPDKELCVQLLIDSSNDQLVFSGTKSGEQLDVAFERYLHRRRVKAGAKLMLRCFMTAPFVKGASRCGQSCCDIAS